MPRERIHWLVVERATQSVSPEVYPAVAQCLRTYTSAAYLGALVHDAPYYYRLGGTKFEHVAEKLHGTSGEDTWDVLRMLAPQIMSIRESGRRRIMWSLFFGMISHVVCDVNFHPMVFFLSGDYYDSSLERKQASRVRHRRFEVWLDSWAAKRGGFVRHNSIAEVIRSLGGQFSLICSFLEENLNPKAFIDAEQVRGLAPNIWQTAFSHMSRIQGLFRSRTAGALANAVCRSGLRRFLAEEALFSYGRGEPHPFFAKPIAYRNPVTGEMFTRTIEDLLKTSVAEALDYCVMFEPLVSGAARDIDEICGGIRGKSLSYGVHNASAEDAQFFAFEPLDLEARSRKEGQ